MIAGFEPLDVMQAILMLVRQVNEGRAEVENQYIRAVTADGNVKAQDAVSPRFSKCATAFEWRGLGQVPYQRAAPCAKNLRAFDAEKPFSPSRPIPAEDNPACECGAILRGVKKPADCKLFGTRLHAGNADGLLHGVLGGLLRRALDLWPLPRCRAKRESRLMNAPRLERPENSISGTAGSTSRTAPAAAPWRN